MSSTLYVLLYVHTDCIEYSEILGLYHDKKEVVDALIEFAHYRENAAGILTQYHIETEEYSSLEELREKVSKEMMLEDTDIYKILTYSPTSG